MPRIWAALDQAFNEQLAGLTQPEEPKTDEAEARARRRDATPVPQFPAHHTGEL